MRYENPELVFTFTGTSPQTITVGDDEIIKDSLVFDYQLMSKELKSSSDRVKFSLIPNSSVTDMLLAYQKDIQVVVKINSVVKFTGYLSSKFTWKLNQYGEQYLSLTVEDNNYLLDRVYSESDTYVNKAALTSVSTGYSGLIYDLCNSCGVTIANAQSLNKTITATIKADAKCKDILQEVCYELGHVYKFNANGQLYLYKIAVENQTSTKTYDSTNLYSVKNNAIDLNKTLRQYNKSIVEYKKYGSRTDTKIYQDISGQDETHPGCNISILPGKSYPSGKNISGTTAAERIAYVDCSDLQEGKELVTIGDNVELIYSASSQTGLSTYIEKSGAKTIGVRLDNNSSNTIVLSVLEATADIIYEESDNKVIAGDASDSKVIDEELSYVHTDDEAKEFANLLAQYYKNSNLEYTFYSADSSSLGDIITLDDDIYTRIADQKLLVRAVEDSGDKNYRKYTAISIEPFNLSASTTARGSGSSPSIIPGPAGADGEDGEDGTSIIAQYALGNSTTTPPSSGWQSTSPTPTTALPYVWMRTSSDDGETWTYTRLTGEQGEPGESGDSKVFNLVVQSKTYKRNMRQSGNQPTISVSTTCIGYTSPQITVECSVAGLLSNGVLTIPYKNAYDTLVITATLTATELEEPLVKTEVLNVDDVTPLPMFIGCVDAMPTTTTEGEIINGDYFCVKTSFTSSSVTYQRGECYRKIEGGWERMTVGNSQASEMLNCLNGFKQAGISLGDISSHDAISWFNSIVADQLIVDTIKGNDAFFDNITIGENSTLRGSIDGDYLKSTNSTTSSKTYISDGTSNTGTFKYEEVGSYIENTVSPSVTPSPATSDMYRATGTIEGKTPLYMAYFSSTPTGYYDVANGTGMTSTKTIETPTYPKVYSLGAISKDASYHGRILCVWEIYNGSTLESSGTITPELWTSSSTIDSITQWNVLPVVQAGRTLKISPEAGQIGIEFFKVRCYSADNFAKGLNVITSSTVYNIYSGSNSGPSYLSYLRGSGSNIKLQIAYTTTVWVQCNSSSWTSGVPKYVGFTGRTGGTAGDSGSGSISSITAYANFSDGTYKSWSSAKTATWGTDFIQFYTSSGTSLGGLTSSSNLNNWYIDFDTTVTSAGLSAAGIVPFTDSTYDFGASNNRWSNGYFDSVTTDGLTTGSFSTTSLTATNLYGILGSTSDRKNAWVDTLNCNAIEGVSFEVFDPATDMIGGSGTDTTSSSVAYFTLPQLSKKGMMGVYSAQALRQITFTVGSSGTYSVVALYTRSYHANNYGNETYSITGKTGGTAFTMGTALASSSISGSAGCIVFYWRTA